MYITVRGLNKRRRPTKRVGYFAHSSRLLFFPEKEAISFNQRVPQANLGIINYCILEKKADNEPAISLPV